MSVKPIDFVTGVERPRAVRSLSEYMAAYTGRHFETFAARSPRNVFTSDDIVAVEMLSVRVPPATSIKLCFDRSHDVSEILDESQLPADVALWDPDLSLVKGGPLWQLWDLIADCGLGGSVVRSKLLAAKRPHAVPIYDQQVAAALGASSRNYWTYWQSQFAGRDGGPLVAAAQSVASEVDAARLLPVLRILDIVIWMRQHGYRSAEDWELRFSDFIEPIRSAG